MVIHYAKRGTRDGIEEWVAYINNVVGLQEEGWDIRILLLRLLRRLLFDWGKVVVFSGGAPLREVMGLLVLS